MVDAKDAAQTIRAANRREQSALQLRRNVAQNLGARLAHTIVAQCPGVTHVWGFGSTFETWRNYRFGSDVDLAIAGGDLLQVLAVTEDFLAGEDDRVPVDLVDLADCSQSMAQFVHTQGRLLAQRVPA